MSDMQRSHIMLLWNMCETGTSLAAVELCMTGFFFAWVLGESSCLHTLCAFFEKLEDSLDQLLIKAIYKALPKVASVYCDSWRSCVWECVSKCVAQREKTERGKG